MRACSLFFTAALVAAPLHAAAAQNPPPTPLRIAASSFASVEVHLNARRIGAAWYEEDASLTGPSRIRIEYGQPHARGRKVEGGLIPLDSVWRLGANMATTLHSDVDFTLGTVAIPRGDYSLFLVHSAGAWRLIVNRRTGQWGSDHDAGEDVGRVTLTSRTRLEPEDSLTIYLVPDAARPATGYAELSGRLRIVWGLTEVSTTWSVAR